MGETKIEWSNATWNPVTGCTKVSPGCTHCYAETMSHRLAHLSKYSLATKDDGVWSGNVSCHNEMLDQPLHWKKPRHIFVCSMSDLFHSQVSWDFIGKVFDRMIECPQHTFQLLTKRPGRMAFWAENLAVICKERGLPWGWPPNVWAGTSVESQKYAPRLDVLARVPAPVRFVSAEPLLGPLDLRPFLHGNCEAWGGTDDGRVLDWVICGGESGPGHRLMDLGWASDLRDQCQAAGVPFFYKQASGPRPGMHRELDGRLWEEMPEWLASQSGFNESARVTACTSQLGFESVLGMERRCHLPGADIGQ